MFLIFESTNNQSMWLRYTFSSDPGTSIPANLVENIREGYQVDGILIIIILYLKIFVRVSHCCSLHIHIVILFSVGLFVLELSFVSFYVLIQSECNIFIKGKLSSDVLSLFLW